jgi:hypothetical protein
VQYLYLFRIDHLTDYSSSAHDSWRALSELADLIEPESKNRNDFIEECKTGKLDGVLVTFRTFNSIDITGLFDEEVISVLPGSLKFVCHNGKLMICSFKLLPFINMQTHLHNCQASSIFPIFFSCNRSSKTD